ncbi:MAG: HDOD domain-containing protein [Myxococcota bacterium]
MLSARNGDAEGPIRVSLSPRDIPPLQTTLMELLGIATDPEVSFDRLEAVIARDQALTLRVLAVANSSYYGCSRRVESARTAVALLGTRQVQNIASAMALAPAFDSRHGPELWGHGLATALWTGHIMESLGTPSIDYLFTAALLHDIGIVLMLRNAPREVAACLEQVGLDRGEIVEIERAQLGVDHAEVGASACVAWKLPERIIKLVAGHHQTPTGEIDGAVLSLAEALASRHGNPEFVGAPEVGWPEEAMDALGIGPEDLEALADKEADVAGEASAFS